MYIDESKTENMHRKQYEKHGTYKHAVNKLNMR